MTFIHRKFEFEQLTATTQSSGRIYAKADGKAYPSITTVLGHLSHEFIQQWRANVGEEEANRVSHHAASRGNAIHNVMEKYINNENIDVKKLMPHHRVSFNNLKPIVDERLSEIYSQEAQLYSDHLGVAGRVDLVGIFDGVKSIIDFKTSRRVKKKEDITGYFLQTCAYAIMFEERTGISIPNLVIIMDIDNNDPVVFKEHRDNWPRRLKSEIQEYHRLQKCRA